MESTNLTNRATVRELVAAFQLAEVRVRKAFAAIVEAERDVNLSFGNETRTRGIVVSACGGYYREDYGNPDAAIKSMRRQAWSTIVDRLELRRVMSIADYDALCKRIEKDDPPEITEEMVSSFVAQYATNLPEIFTTAAKEVFEWLRPRHKRYKTNSEFEVPSKVVLEYITEARDKRWSFTRFRVTYHTAQRLIALENVFNALDGKGQICRDHFSALQRAIESTSVDVGCGETDLFSFRCFENGNAHIKFKRMDLLKKFNALCGGNRLHA